MNFAKYRVQLSTEKKYSSKYEYKYEYEYSIPACNWQQPFLNQWKDTVEIISWSISIKVWDRVRIELSIPGSAVGLATDCTMGPGQSWSGSNCLTLVLFLNDSLEHIY